MVAKLFPKILIEGARFTRTTELSLALHRHPRIVGTSTSRTPTPLFSGEWPAFTNLPSGRGLINFGAEEEGQAMEAFETWARLFELLPYSSWLVDRFHLSAQVHQSRGRNRRYDFGWLEQRLRPLGFRVILCTRSRDSLGSGGVDSANDLDALFAEQEDFRRAVEDSILPSLELDMSDGDIGRAVERIADWLHGTGGVRPPWVNDVDFAEVNLRGPPRTHGLGRTGEVPSREWTDAPGAHSTSH